VDDISRHFKDVRVIDEYINFGAAQIEKARSNFRYRIESVITGARESKELATTLSQAPSLAAPLKP
jgi:hypothetical protein